ncbi:succinate dehydrogenase assembly factor 2 family protein [[Haemophilus] felis]|uniref:FAD assembly factor SdhE n=1 Tax=[Haemophilus] felis TaxID=123822 RepID=A0A1T0B1E2_9PAST|nr:succinate dehydrogenase assembly factor 2 family protein [[Haemophilus] felis]NBI41146.1 succinate dehydrogenase assembly factor 2 family protein [[Haemophilus] felis]OOS03846.1 succinate dehydrogenase assembly factor 2 family protein [[Haemophilus] felis]
MDKYNKLRIEWDCRRGMLELDKVIMPFYLQFFDQLNDSQKDVFIRLLACSDLELFSWFFNRKQPTDLELQQMVEHIQIALKLNN